MSIDRKECRVQSSDKTMTENKMNFFFKGKIASISLKIGQLFNILSADRSFKTSVSTCDS